MWSVPVLVLVSLVTFGLSRCTPDDPVVQQYGEIFTKTFDPEANSHFYQQEAQRLHLDLPAFYFTLTTRAFPDTFHRIFPPERRAKMEAMTMQTGNWLAVQTCEQALARSVRAMEALPDSLAALLTLRPALVQLLSANDTAVWRQQLEMCQRSAIQLPSNTSVQALHDALHATQAAVQHWQRTPQRAQLYTPVLYWYGLSNQYHRWMTGFFTGDLGYSFKAKKRVWDELRTGFWLTLFISVTALFLGVMAAVPLGAWLAKHRAQRTDRWGQRLLLLVYALPAFWTGSLLIAALATPGKGLFLIPGLALTTYLPQQMSFGSWMADNAVKFILPILTIMVDVATVLALYMRSSILAVQDQDFVRTARAKGLTERRVFWRHIFPNSLFPLVVQIVRTFPSLLGGTLIIEYLFNLPGMGLKTQEAFLGRDYPVLFAIVMIGAFFTIICQLVGDWLYAWLDPRVQYTEEEQYVQSML